MTAVGTNPASVGSHYRAGIDGLNINVTNQLWDESAAAVQATDQSGQNTTATIEPDDGTVNWPAGAQLVYQATAAGQSVNLTFQVMSEADYALGLAITHSPDAGQLASIGFKIGIGQVAAAAVDGATAATSLWFITRLPPTGPICPDRTE